AWIEQVKANMPELPSQRRERFMHELKLTAYDAAQLTMHKSTADYFETVASELPNDQAKLAANWVLGELAAALNRAGLECQHSPVTPTQLAALIKRIIDGTISNKMAREVFEAMWEGEHQREADAIIDARGLKQI